MNRILISAVALLMAAAPCVGRVKPASLVTSNMVLQQKTDARLWGTAKPGSTVTATPSWQGAVPSTAKAGADGQWMLTVATPEGGFTPYTITLTDGDGPETVLTDVLIGEVWLASGQSNMQMPLKGYPGCCLKGGYDEVASASQQAGRIRFITLPLVQSYEPTDTVNARWVKPSPTTAPDFSALCWHLAKRLTNVIEVPVGIVSAAYGGARVESWTPREILETYDDVSLDKADIDSMTHYLRPLLMYNAMFVPVKNYTYRGILWYQGCSNVDSYATYAERLATMVEHWRKEIGLGDIPFYAVEIAPYDYESGNGPLIREAQWKSIELIPNSDMICTNDLVEPYERFNIHPADKTSVGNRLCDVLLNRTYGHKEFPVGSPRYKSHRIEGNEAWVAIESPNDGICRNYDIRGFELAGADGIFHEADSARLNWQTNEIVISSDKVDAPVYVRYGFRDFMPGTLHGGNYLPLIPFRTDSLEK